MYRVSIIVSVAIFALITSCGVERRSNVYIIPKGYTGLITVKYAVNGKPPLEIVGGRYQIAIPESGYTETAASLEDGWGRDEYYEGAATEANRLYFVNEGSPDPKSQRIWDFAVHDGGEAPPSVSFFVGTKAGAGIYERKLQGLPARR